jgi:hypothetical protein
MTAGRSQNSGLHHDFKHPIFHITKAYMFAVIEVPGIAHAA